MQMLQVKRNFILIVMILLFALYEAIVIIMNDKLNNISLKVFAVIIILSVMYIGMQRNVYLPFLGPSVLPASLLKSDFALNNASRYYKVPMKDKDGLKVVYWASKPSDKIISNPWKAYEDFENAGISTIQRGHAMMYVDCPSSYRVRGRVLSPHIHYRIVYPNGILGEVKTVFVNC